MFESVVGCWVDEIQALERDDVIVQASCGSQETAACFESGEGSLFTQCLVNDTFDEIISSSWRCTDFEWA